MREDFCAVIITHGRPDKIPTYNSLRRHGYTGRIFIVVDDEDKRQKEAEVEKGWTQDVDTGERIYGWGG